MNKVVGLNGIEIPSGGTPDENVVRALEEALEQARSGEIISVCIAKLHHDLAGSWTIAGVQHSYAMIGTNAVMAKNYLEYLSD